jgi:hypothetical protein
MFESKLLSSNSETDKFYQIKLFDTAQALRLEEEIEFLRARLEDFN